MRRRREVLLGRRAATRLAKLRERRLAKVKKAMMRQLLNPKSFFLLGREAILFVTTSFNPRLAPLGKVLRVIVGRIFHHIYIVHKRQHTQAGTGIMEMMCGFFDK
jgi:hypothetical protein